ncbi:MAG: PIG-L family deacetylase [candidate division Zixibacteria bacterium]|nr:PIG-L family deacetylase [candidate division Zixibacteria bacterium]
MLAPLIAAFSGVSTAQDSTITHPRRIAVFAPHPDDEVLGPGAAIKRAVDQGDSVFVFVMTTGDSNEKNCKVVFGHRCSAEDLMEYGRRRQEESRRALLQLGVPPNQVSFLGYPDHLLADLFQTYGADSCRLGISHPIPTGAVRTYCRNFFGDSTSVEYCANNVFHDVKAALTAVRPDVVYVTDLHDSHPDHAATGAFVMSALADLATDSSLWKPSNAEVRAFIIHFRKVCGGKERSWYPFPEGDHADFDLIEPSYQKTLSGVNVLQCLFDHVGKPSGTLTLTSDLKAAKKSAIGEYRTQLTTDVDYMASFVRNNEEWWSHVGRDIANPPDGYLTLTAVGPVELAIVDPNGRKLDVLENDIPDGLYLKVKDKSGSGLNRVILIPDPLRGVYTISTTGATGSGSTDRYSLYASHRGRQTWIAKGASLRVRATGHYVFETTP